MPGILFMPMICVSSAGLDAVEAMGLDHKDFEAFRAEAVQAWEKLNERLESDEFAEEWSTKEAALQKEFEEENAKDQKQFLRIASVFIAFLVAIGAWFVLEDYNNNNKRDQQTSRALGSIELTTS